jgi:hypothetical protein
MIRTLAKASIAIALLYGGQASAQVFEAHVGVSIPAPTIQFDVEPPLVVVTPGVYVVEDYDQEVFFTDGWYWSRRGDVWYRTRDHRGGWVAAPPRYVPGKIRGLPPGHYRHFRSGPGHPMYRSARGPERHGDHVAPRGARDHRTGRGGDGPRREHAHPRGGRHGR